MSFKWSAGRLEDAIFGSYGSDISSGFILCRRASKIFHVISQSTVKVKKKKKKSFLLFTRSLLLYRVIAYIVVLFILVVVTAT